MDPYQSTFDAYNELARDYQEKFMHFDLYNDTYDAFCGLIDNPKARIFEIGCGPGNITRYILDKCPELRITAIDAAPGMVRLAAENNPQAVCKVMDARDISFLHEKFEGIICGFCLPYLSKEDGKKLISDSSALLAPGGIFYISFIEDTYDKSAWETSSNGQYTMFIYYHEEGYMTAWLNENGFELVSACRKKYTAGNRKETTHLVMIARKKE